MAGVPEIKLFGPGKISVIETHVDASTNIRTYITEIVFPKPVRYGESVEFTLVKRANIEFDQVIRSSGWDWYGLTMASPVEHVSVGLRFPLGKQPRKVWRYEDMVIGLLTRPGSLNVENRLAIDSSGYVASSWSEASAGYSYGIAFDW